MSQIGISYTPSGSTTVYSFSFSQFVDAALPRSYVGSTVFSFSGTGAAIVSGSTSVQKRIWAISSPIPTNEAESFDEMYRAWDTDRANGIAAAVGIVDQTFGATVSSSAVFSTAPTYSQFGHAYMVVSFGLTEI